MMVFTRWMWGDWDCEWDSVLVPSCGLVMGTPTCRSVQNLIPRTQEITRHQNTATKRRACTQSLAHPSFAFIFFQTMYVFAFNRQPPGWNLTVQTSPFTWQKPAKKTKLLRCRQGLQRGIAQLMALTGVQLHVQQGHAQTLHIQVLKGQKNGWTSKLRLGVWRWILGANLQTSSKFSIQDRAFLGIEIHFDSLFWCFL